MLDSKPLQIVIATACISTLVLLTNKSDLSESTKNAYRKFLEDIRLENCPNSPLHLVNKSEAVNWKTNEDKQFPPKLTQINREFDFPQASSLFKPEYYGSNYPSCNKASNGSKIAFIIPYRNRPVQLRVFLNHMIPLFLKQQLQFKIYVIDQVPHTTFNRAKLFNVGFDIAKKDAELMGVEWDCYTFHDVDLYLENESMLYKCDAQGNPRHLSVSVSSMGYSIEETYKWDIFGGICQVTGRVFEMANGFANHYWGWGGEDDDLQRRLTKGLKLPIVRPDGHIARYTMYGHEHEESNSKDNDNKKFLMGWSSTWKTSGLSDLEYKVLSVTRETVYEKFLVDIGDV